MQVRQLIDDVVKDAMRAKPDAPAANANASYEVEDVSTPSLENSNAGITPATPTPSAPDSSGGMREELLKRGITQEYVDNAYKPKAGEGFFERYKKHVPEPVDDSQNLGKARTIGAISDAVGLIAQLWGAGQGARMTERSPESFATSQINDRADALRNLYLQRLQRYQAGLIDADSRDYITDINEGKEARRNIQSIIQNIQAEKLKKQLADDALRSRESIAAENRRIATENNERNRELAEKRIAETARHNKAMEGNAAARTKAYVDRMGKIGDTSKKGKKKEGWKTFSVGTTSDDPLGLSNGLGGKTRRFALSPSGVEGLASEALQDDVFMAVAGNIQGQKREKIAQSYLDYLTSSGETDKGVALANRYLDSLLPGYSSIMSMGASGDSSSPDSDITDEFESYSIDEDEDELDETLSSLAL